VTATVPMSPLRLPDAQGYTVDDLHALPDDGRRYELIDGSIIVSPSATIDHNTIALWIATILWDSVPDGRFVVGTDQSTTIDDHNEPRPDVVVARVRNLRRSPFPMDDAILVVEVVSPSSGLRDRETKRALYARAGVASYWLVEPDEKAPTIGLTEFTLGPGKEYLRVGTWASGAFRTDLPWPLRLDLDALTERRARLMREAEAMDRD
jgi:Uma2 family endonuclease